MNGDEQGEEEEVRLVLFQGILWLRKKNDKNCLLTDIFNNKM